MKPITWIVKIAVMVIAAIVLFGWVTMLLWNWLVPELFNGPVINFWQTLGLLALSKIFFWSFAKGHHRNSHWKPYWKEKWTSMSAEDRDRFKQKMKDKWCGSSSRTSADESGTSTV